MSGKMHQIFPTFHTSVKRRKIIFNSYNYNFFSYSFLFNIYNNYVFLKIMFRAKSVSRI